MQKYATTTLIKSIAKDYNNHLTIDSKLKLVFRRGCHHPSCHLNPEPHSGHNLEAAVGAS